MLAGLRTPGSRSSEFLVTCLNVLVQIILAAENVISNGSAVKMGVGGTIAYIVSRGFAKYEQRPGGGGPSA